MLFGNIIYTILVAYLESVHPSDSLGWLFDYIRLYGIRDLVFR